MMRWEVINALIERFDYKSYLEIGHGNGDCINRVVCDKKMSIDPNGKGTIQCTSDQFFSHYDEMFDIIFIDGLHESKQVTEDIYKSLGILNYEGTIVMHDCDPFDEASQIVPRQQVQWNGDVWKTFVDINKYDVLDTFVIDTDCGIGVIQNPLFIKSISRISDRKELKYSEFVLNKKEWLNLQSIEWFKSWLTQKTSKPSLK